MTVDLPMRLPVVFMYSGQGSQYYQMGRELYHHHPGFKAWMNRCDRIFFPHLQTSLIDEIYHEKGRENDFDRILYTNPALLAIEFSLTKVVMEMGVEPDYLIGHSLGEFVAAVVADCISLEDAAEWFVGIARSLEAEPGSRGRMLSILDSDLLLSSHSDFFQSTWLASKNFASNFVMSGAEDDIERLKQELFRQNIVSQMLPVKYAFHTARMESVKQAFFGCGTGFDFAKPAIPIISSCTTEEVENIGVDHFWKVTRQVVDFQETILNLTQQENYLLVDLGPSGTLATFVKHMLPKESGSHACAAITPFGKDINSMRALDNAMTDNALRKIC